MISYTDYDDDMKSTCDGCFPLINNIISRASKEQNNVTLSSDEVKYTTAGRSGKKMLWMKQMLKEYNVRHDVMTLV